MKAAAAVNSAKRRRSLPERFDTKDFSKQSSVVEDYPSQQLNNERERLTNELPTDAPDSTWAERPPRRGDRNQNGAPTVEQHGTGSCGSQSPLQPQAASTFGSSYRCEVFAYLMVFPFCAGLCHRLPIWIRLPPYSKCFPTPRLSMRLFHVCSVRENQQQGPTDESAFANRSSRSTIRYKEDKSSLQQKFPPHTPPQCSSC
ncbi:unnamed protein product [Pleuronectes platessa]|uniref:Uncharacterized protein n=1 Tax=Pleuronectes platessa TaxID=8262 RepID=A0A9N7TMK0_PLEPL|nr:unnamed protein product [Pleuronectes platessa]